MVKMEMRKLRVGVVVEYGYCYQWYGYCYQC